MFRRNRISRTCLVITRSATRRKRVKNLIECIFDFLLRQPDGCWLLSDGYGCLQSWTHPAITPIVTFTMTSIQIPSIRMVWLTATIMKSVRFCLYSDFIIVSLNLFLFQRSTSLWSYSRCVSCSSCWPAVSSSSEILWRWVLGSFGLVCYQNGFIFRARTLEDSWRSAESSSLAWLDRQLCIMYCMLRIYVIVARTSSQLLCLNLHCSLRSCCRPYLFAVSFCEVLC